MYYLKTGLPEEGELVMCKVIKIQYNSIFVEVTEYNKTGMIHISEISPGRIRNIHDFVKLGKIIVCKVLRVNKERGQIDLSLRRVSESLRREKVNILKQEQRAEKIVEHVAKNLNKDVKNMYEEISAVVYRKYDSLYPCFEEFIKNPNLLKELDLRDDIRKPLEEAIKLRIKPPEVTVNGKLKMSSFSPDGIDVIKNAIDAGQKIGKENLTVIYEGGGSYHLIVKSDNYKDGEKRLKEVVDAISNFTKKDNGFVEYKKI